MPPLGDPLSAHVRIAGARLEVDAPAGTVVRLLRDGRAVAETDALSGPASYRVELLRRGSTGLVPWLLPSPLRVE